MPLGLDRRSGLSGGRAGGSHVAVLLIVPGADSVPVGCPIDILAGFSVYPSMPRRRRPLRVVIPRSRGCESGFCQGSPFPLPDLGHVLAVLGDVLLVLEQLVAHGLL